MSDTDSLLMVCKHDSNEDGLQGMVDAGILDTSNFPPNHPMYTAENTAKLGFWKSVTADEEIEEHVGVRSKANMMRLRRKGSKYWKDKCTL